MTTLPQPSRVSGAAGLDLALLGGHHEAVALHLATATITYGELAQRVATEAASLGTTRRVVVLRARNDVDTVVRLLAAWAGHHPVVLLGADDAERHHEIAERYADVRGDALHPDLALLLSTSGSTGSPKLVRLSRANVLANAAAIATYLALRPDDRAITSLPLHYCYGLSVLTSHLLAGAGVVLTDLSVADECFWDLATRTRTTSLAGVPYTFDLLDAGRFAERDLPDLRRVTQAGGRLAPDVVRRFAELGARRGWDLFVMYGATEATARMAYLPPALVGDRPDAIGVPVPGGDFRLDPVEGAEVPDGAGELVYTGPNVMMGYATGVADLARGAELTELRTGDLARQADDGLWEVLGRLDRHAKVFGLRLDLARLESTAPHPTTLVAHGDRLHAFVGRPRCSGAVREHVVAAAGLPPGAVVVHTLDPIPTTSRGKVDHAALRRHASAADAVGVGDEVTPSGGGRVDARAVRDLYAVVLARPDAGPDDSFVDLGGDSLAFVEVSTRLGALLGDLPRGWQHLAPAVLVEQARPARRFTAPVEVPTLLRAVAIVAIVASHTDLVRLMGGAHVLLAVAGYNLARFALRTEGRTARARAVLRAVAAVAVPASAWIALTGLLTGDYRPATALYLNQATGVDHWTGDWQFWFLEVLVWGLVGIAALLLVPQVDAWQRRHRFETALLAVVVTLGLRYLLVGQGTVSLQEYTIGASVFCVALGWAAAEASSWPQRMVVAALVIVSTWGYFGDDPLRQGVVAVGVLALLVDRPVRLPTVVVGAVVALAQASLWIYLTHWQVYWPLEEAGHRWYAALASIVVGLAAARAHVALQHGCRRWWRRDGLGSPGSAGSAHRVVRAVRRAGR